MGLLEILLKPMKHSATSFLDNRPQTIDYKKVRTIAETILESQSATKEQRQKAMKMLCEARKLGT